MLHQEFRNALIGSNHEFLNQLPSAIVRLQCQLGDVFAFKFCARLKSLKIKRSSFESALFEQLSEMVLGFQLSVHTVNRSGRLG